MCKISIDMSRHRLESCSRSDLITYFWVSLTRPACSPVTQQDFCRRNSLFGFHPQHPPKAILSEIEWLHITSKYFWGREKMFSSMCLKESSQLREGRKQWEKTERKHNWILLGLFRLILFYTSCTLKSSWQRNYFLAGYVSALAPLILDASRWILALILLFDNLVFKEFVRFSTSLSLRFG